MNPIALMNKNRAWAWTAVKVAIWLAVLPVQSLAVDSDFQPVHWGFSAFFGTGWYQVDDARSVFVLRIPPRQTVRESSYGGVGDRQIGIEIHYPLTLGLHNIDDLPGIAIGADDEPWLVGLGLSRFGPHLKYDANSFVSPEQARTPTANGHRLLRPSATSRAHQRPSWE